MTLVHEYSTTIDAEPERVFAALTTEAELRRWFAEELSLEPAKGGAFRFSGRGAYAPTAGVVTRFEPPRVVAFAYPIEGVPGEVTLTLARDGERAGATKLALRHAFPEPPPVARAKELVDDLWRLALSNLGEHLKGGKGVLLPDFHDPSPEVRLSVYIDAAPHRVFRGLVDPELLDRWVSKKAVVEARVGGRYSFGWSFEIDGKQIDGGPTRILELIEDEKLVVDWPDWRGDTSVPAQRLTYLLAPEGAGTRLTLIHDGFVRVADIGDYASGWAWFVDRLGSVVEGKLAPAPLEG